MNTSKLGLVVLGLILALSAGYLGANLKSNGNFGVGITPYNCLNNQILCNELNAIASSTANIAQGSATLNSTTVNGTTTVTGTVTVTGAVAGDGCVIGVSTSTANVAGSCLITAANTATYYFAAATSTVTTIATTTVYATNLPRATFVAPTGL